MLPECYLFRMNQLHGKEGLSFTNRWYLEALNIVTTQHPWWNRTQVGLAALFTPYYFAFKTRFT
jgi:hypothetical protein